MLPVVPTRSDKRSSIRHSPVEPDQCLVPIYPERFCMIQVQGIADTGQSKGLTGDQHGCNEPWETIDDVVRARSEEHTSELQSLMRISYAVFCLKKKTTQIITLLHYVHHYQDLV